MADGNITTFPRRPALRVVETAPAGTYPFPAPSGPLTGPKASREPRFRNFGGDVYLGTYRLSPEAVEVILRDYQREALKSGDWSLHDELQAARDGITEPPPEAA